ncbi:hypothetical protein BaRGS_00000902 [Batillaria attramentaria]|uniref:Uncharacterized protein n=1 Tax=Batillaria attramentaria TaxID=370345 RepID=A0ABD0M8R2_9CAEN
MFSVNGKLTTPGIKPGGVCQVQTRIPRLASTLECGRDCSKWMWTGPMFLPSRFWEYTHSALTYSGRQQAETFV